MGEKWPYRDLSFLASYPSETIEKPGFSVKIPVFWTFWTHDLDNGKSDYIIE
jgi:hypothetical protein